MFDTSSVVVFTVPERCDLFRSVFGDGADYRVSPYESIPFDLALENAYAGGGTLAVVDELHFFGIEQLAGGVRAYLDKPENKGRTLRLILVCPDREPGDEWLGYFTSYLGLYDIVYAVQGAGTVAQLARLAETPNERVDVLPLLGGRRAAGMDVPAPAASGASGPAETYELETGGFTVSIQISVVPSEGAWQASRPLGFETPR